jgi:biotin carboxyl carrier protein
MRVSLRDKHHHLAVELRPAGGGFRVTVDQSEHIVETQVLDASTVVISIDGRRVCAHIARDGHQRFVAINGAVYAFAFEPGGGGTHQVDATASPDVVAPMPGKVLQVLTHVGQHVDLGDGLLILEAMKMETRLSADAAGTVRDVRVQPGDMVVGGQVLVVLEFDPE